MIVRNHSRKQRRGSAIVMTLVSLTAVATLSVVMLEMASDSQSEQRQASELVHAQYAAEAAANRAVASLRAGGSGALGSASALVAFGSSEYWVQSNVPSPANPGDVGTLTAVANDDRATARVEVTLMATPQSIWRFAAFGDETLHMDSNARTDSYDSTLGSYLAQALNGSGASAYANDDGNVGSNGDITMDQNSKVWGDAACGPEGTTTVLGNAIVAGATTPAFETIDLPALVVPTYASLGSVSVNGTIALASGNYQYDTMLLRAGAIVDITGPANVVMTNFVMRSGAQFRVDSTNGPVKIYVKDDFILNSNSSIYSTNYDPSKVEINLVSDNVIDPDVVVDLDVIDFDSNTKVFGTVFAPNAHIEVDSNFELFGAMIARSIDLDSNARVHYDENLARVKTDGTLVWETVAWRALAPQTRQAGDSGGSHGTVGGGSPESGAGANQ